MHSRRRQSRIHPKRHSIHLIKHYLAQKASVTPTFLSFLNTYTFLYMDVIYLLEFTYNIEYISVIFF